MRAALVIYDSLDRVSGGYLYDRMLVSKMREHGDDVTVIAQRRRSYALNLFDNASEARVPLVELLIQDELNHPSLFLANRRRRRAPIISIVHHLRSAERRPAWQNAIYARIERLYLNTVDGFVFNSETTRTVVRQHLKQEKPFVVATPGGDRLGSARPQFVKSRLAQRKELRLLTVGSVIPSKGLDVLLEALGMLQGEAMHLHVVGPEGAAPAFAARMRRRAASTRTPVEFHGPLADGALKALLESSDVFVMPSYYEGFGIAYLEAMAHGIPCIGAATGAVPSLIHDEQNGYLTAPGDAGQLAGRLRALSHDPDLLLRLSLNALESAGRFATWDESTERIRDFLLSMVRTNSNQTE